MGDAHVYLDHIEARKKQLNREPRESPEFATKRRQWRNGWWESGRTGHERIQTAWGHLNEDECLSQSAKLSAESVPSLTPRNIQATGTNFRVNDGFA